MIRCAGCGEPIHGNHDACMSDVDGEDIRTHTVLLVTRTGAPRPHAQPKGDT